MMQMDYKDGLFYFEPFLFYRDLPKTKPNNFKDVTMIKDLPQSLIATSASILQETIELEHHKALADKWSNESKDSSGLTKAQQISKHVMPPHINRKTIALSANSIPDEEVSNFLTSNGYQVEDYVKGIVTKGSDSKNKLSIGKILHNRDKPDLLHKFNMDPARFPSDGMKIVVTRHPYDIVGMSTHQRWHSCLGLESDARYKADGSGFVQDHHEQEGSNSEHLEGMLKGGTHAAYLVHAPVDVKQHERPVARVLFYPYTSHDGSHTVLRPANRVYGGNSDGFHETVSKWAEEHFPLKHPTYHLGVYDDALSSRTIHNYAPELDEYWKQHPTDDVARDHPSHDVLEHYSKNLHILSTVGVKELLGNKNITKEQSERIINHPHFTSKYIDDYLSVVPNKHIVDGVIERTSNPRTLHRIAEINQLTPEQHDKMIDKVTENGITDVNLHRILLQHPATTTKHIDKLYGKFGEKFLTADDSGTIANEVMRNSKNPEIMKDIVSNPSKYHIDDNHVIVKRMVDEAGQNSNLFSTEDLSRAHQRYPESYNLSAALFNRYAKHEPKLLHHIKTVRNPTFLDDVEKKYPGHAGLQNSVKIARKAIDNMRD